MPSACFIVNTETYGRSLVLNEGCTRGTVILEDKAEIETSINVKDCKLYKLANLLVGHCSEGKGPELRKLFETAAICCLAFVENHGTIPALNDYYWFEAQAADSAGRLLQTYVEAFAKKASEKLDVQNLYRFCCIMICNSHIIGKSTAALFPLVSKCAHSCDPNSLPCYNTARKHMQLKALRDLRKGEVVSISYLPPLMILCASKAFRQLSLRAQKLFQCQCPRCALDDGGAEALSREQTYISALEQMLAGDYVLTHVESVLEESANENLCIENRICLSLLICLTILCACPHFYGWGAAFSSGHISQARAHLSRLLDLLSQFQLKNQFTNLQYLKETVLEQFSGRIKKSIQTVSLNIRKADGDLQLIEAHSETLLKLCCSS